MIHIQTKLNVVDNSGGRLVRCINIIGKQKSAKVGQLILVTLLKLISNKKVKKKVMYLGLIVSVQYWNRRLDGSLIKFFSNRVLLFNRKYKFLGTRVYGVISKELKIYTLKDKNYRKNFQKVITYSSLII